MNIFCIKILRLMMGNQSKCLFKGVSKRKQVYSYSEYMIFEVFICFDEPVLWKTLV